ncbi:MAG TPA: cbb3-type cytochrome c oxidase subunit I [Anaerolineales bacterium]|jgi:cytochrome c oxidase subunit 1|nr:cbb3-type cytochrome c oxidase subunit I [Anaerolineales bacterium]HQX15757.1 cbb3-type cytochrome c oxidase subunit I [Anaerolineales bacterium]
MATLAPTFPWAKDSKDDYRTCPVLTLKVDMHAERLIIANAVMAVVTLTIGGIAALLIALTRWQAVHLLDATWFYRLLTIHGIDMLIAWMVFFEIAGLHFGSTVLLNARHAAPKTAWFAFILMTVGGLMANVVVLIDPRNTVAYTAYMPLKASPLFYLSYILFAVGALIAVITFFINIVVAKREKRFEGSLPLVAFGFMTAAILATYTLLQGAAAVVPAFLWSAGILSNFDPGIYRNFFWGFGHPAQQVNLAAMISIWYSLAQITVGIRPVNEKFSRLAFVLYLFFINLGSAHHLLVDPGLSFSWKAVNTSYAMYLAVLGSMMHAFSIPAALEVALRAKGYRKGLFGWLRNAPWGEPGFAALVVSMVMFGWIGGVTGVVIGTEQINLLVHNTMRLPGHFHATVVSGTTTAFMGFTYYIIPLIFRKELKLKKWAVWQPYVFGGGMLLVSLGMIVSGLQGVSRRNWDITFSGVVPGTIELSLAIFGIGAIIAVIGGIMYVAIVLTSILTGPRLEASKLLLVSGDNNPVLESTKLTEHDLESKQNQPKGSFVLVIAFLVWFAVYYLTNWWLLGRTWFIR